MIGMGVFWHQSKPEEAIESEPVANASAEEVEEKSLQKVNISTPEKPTERDPVGTDNLQATPVSAVSEKPDSFGIFTGWMTPDELDQHIRTINEGYELSFWERGHWINAVEGRWHEGNHQFRIRYESMPSPNAWEWKYRVDQTQEEFFESIQSMATSGYSLVQSHSYRRPDGSQRFQAVWRRNFESPSIADSNSGLVPELDSE